MHEQCLAMIGMIEDFILDEQYSSLTVTVFSVNEEIAKRVMGGEEVLDVLESIDNEGFQRVITKQVVMGLFKDFCYFMQEALNCSLKKRLVITFALLRRAIIDDVKIMLRVCCDEEFFDNFSNRDDYDPTVMKDEVLKNYLTSIDSSRMIQIIKGCDIYNIVFDKNNPISLLNLTNRALQPVTTRGINKTGIMNLNFNYMNEADNLKMWDCLYSTLSVVLLYYFELSNIIVFGLLDQTLSQDLLIERYKKVQRIMNIQ